MSKGVILLKQWIIIMLFTMVTYKLHLIIKNNIYIYDFQIVLNTLIILGSIRFLDLFSIHTERRIRILNLDFKFFFAIILFNLIVVIKFGENVFSENFAIYAIRYPGYILLYSGIRSFFTPLKVFNNRMFVLIDEVYYVKDIHNNKLNFVRFDIFKGVKKELEILKRAGKVTIGGYILIVFADYKEIEFTQLVNRLFSSVILIIFVYLMSKIVLFVIKISFQKGALKLYLDNERADNMKKVKKGLDRYTIDDLYFYDFDPTAPVKLELDKEFLHEKKKSILLNGKWGVGKTTLIETYYSNEVYIDVMKYGSGQNNMAAIFKQLCKWYSVDNIIINIMNIWSNPELLKYIVLANTVLIGSLGVITDVLVKIITNESFQSIWNISNITIILVIANLIFLQLLPYLVFDNDPKSTKYRKLYLDHIVCSLNNKILILDNLDRIEYEQLIDMLEVVNYMNKLNVNILTLAEKDELINTLKTNNRYGELSKPKLESYLRKYFEDTINYISKSQYYTRETIKYCSVNNIRVSNWTQHKLFNLFACMPDEFEYRELNQFHNLIIKMHSRMTIDLLLLVFFDITLSANRIISDERLMPELYIGSSGILSGVKFGKILEQLITNECEANVYMYLNEVKNETPIENRERYIFDDELTYENVQFFRATSKPIDDILKVEKIYGEHNLRRNISCVLPGDYKFLNDEEEKILSLLKYGLKAYDIYQARDYFLEHQPSAVSCEYIISIGAKKIGDSKNIFRKLYYCIKRKMIDYQNEAVDYHKIWGQYMYDFYIERYDFD